MHEQSNKDVQRDAIQSRLSKILLKNYGNFIDGMKQIQARVTGVTMTCMHLLTSRGLCVCVWGGVRRTWTWTYRAPRSR